MMYENLLTYSPRSNDSTSRDLKGLDEGPVSTECAPYCLAASLHGIRLQFLLTLENDPR